MKIPPRTQGKRRAQAQYAGLGGKLIQPAERYIHSETVSGAFLFAAAVLALAWANSPWSPSYFGLRELPIAVEIGGFHIHHSLKEWVNDGLMVLFFFVVALEVKRELVFGELSERRKAALPIAAALGGMAVPAAIFLALNAGRETARGWGIPMATDIAFAVAALALLGSRVPLSLRIFLLSYAIIDDIGAILVIALFYTGDISWPALGTAALFLSFTILLRRMGTRNFSVYWALGIAFWGAMLLSGVHATIAGVILGALAPAKALAAPNHFFERLREREREIHESLASEEAERSEELIGELEELAKQTESPLERLERNVHPWVSFGILPLFAMLNAGVAVSPDLIRAAAESPMVIGIVLGLVFGKPLGITLVAWLSVRLGLATLPDQVAWRHIVGVGFLGGIGFTVALFIAGLAFADEARSNEATIGILAASLAAMAAGCLLLRFFPARENS